MKDRSAPLQPHVSPNPTRPCILVLGMHRSGTSALCGVLHQLGAERPLRELPPQPDNEKGFFEPSEVVAIHDRMLDSAGLYWFDWEALPAGWSATPQTAAFRDALVAAVKADFPGSGPFLVKDPRLCRFVGLWLSVIAEVGARPVVVFQYRDPLEVAGSLKARDHFPLAHGLLTWLRHNLDAERDSRGVERTFVSYDHLLKDWRRELVATLAQDRLGLTRRSARAMAAAGGFLDGGLRHQARGARAMRDALPLWCEETLAALDRLREDPYEPDAMRSLDRVREAFDLACDAFTPAFQDLLVQVERHQQVIARFGAVETALGAAQQAVGDLSPLADRVPGLEQELAAQHAATAAAQALAAQLPGLQAALDASRHEQDTLRAVADRVPALEAELAAQQAMTAAAQALADQLPALEAAQIDAHRQMSALTERAAALDAALAASRDEVAGLRPASEAVPLLQQDLDAARAALASARAEADRVPVLQAECDSLRQTLAAAESIAAEVPDLQAGKARAEEALAVALPRAERLAGVEAELDLLRNRVNALQTELDLARRKLDQTLGARVSSLFGRT